MNAVAPGIVPTKFASFLVQSPELVCYEASDVAAGWGASRQAAVTDVMHQQGGLSAACSRFDLKKDLPECMVK